MRRRFDSSSDAALDPSVDTDGTSEGVRCPYCDGTNTEREHPKGPSLCRSMHFCRECEEPFEAIG